MFRTNFVTIHSIIAILGVLAMGCGSAEAPGGSAELRRADNGRRGRPWSPPPADAGAVVADAGPTVWPTDSAVLAPADAGPIVLLVDSGPTIPPPETDAGAPAPADAGPIVVLVDSGPTIRTPEVDSGASAPADAGPVVVVADSAPTIFGVTIDDPWAAERSSAVLDALDGLVRAGGRPPMARVVFDSGIDRVFQEGGSTAVDYVGPIAAIGAHAQVMGELLDSFYVPDYDTAQYRARACEYRATLGHLVDVWEVGNEVNGEWLLAPGDAASVVVDKIVAAVEVFQADAAGFAALCPGFALRDDERPFELALTAYANGDASSTGCWANRAHHMETWLAAHFGPGGRGAAVRDAFDLVLVSYYEDDCEDLQPDWQAVFDRIGAIFPAARLGIGECGTIHLADAARYVGRYYGGPSSTDPALANMHVTHPRYVGGMFWWYFSRDFGNPTIYGALRETLDDPFWAR